MLLCSKGILAEYGYKFINYDHKSSLAQSRVGCRPPQHKLAKLDNIEKMNCLPVNTVNDLQAIHTN
jgi:hypothetical protein